MKTTAPLAKKETATKTEAKTSKEKTKVSNNESKKVDTKKTKDDNNKEEAKDNKSDAKPKNINYKLTTIILGIACVVLAIGLIFALNKPNTKYNISSILEPYKDKNVTLSLPADYRIGSDGAIYYVGDNSIKPICSLTCVEATEEDFNEAMEYYKTNLGLTEEEPIGDFKVGKIATSANGVDYSYYFLFKDGLFNEFIFLNCDEDTIATVIKGLDY